MFIPVLESMSKITEATVGMQQEMFKRWFSFWPGVPTVPSYPRVSGEQVQQFQKKWAETVTELLKRHRETVETQFKAGQQNIETVFQLGEAKNPEELRARSLELWQKCIEAVRQTSEAQTRDFQVAVEKWFELMMAPLRPDAFTGVWGTSPQSNQPGLVDCPRRWSHAHS